MDQKTSTPRPDMIQGSGVLVHGDLRIINNVQARLFGDKYAWVYPLMGGMGGELVIEKAHIGEEREKEGREKRGLRKNERWVQLSLGPSGQMNSSEEERVWINIASKGYDKNKRQ